MPPDIYSGPFTELVYDADAEPWFAEQWPEATFVDASDIVHDGRFEVTIPGKSEDDVYPVVMRDGWALCCFKLCLTMRIGSDENTEKIERWMTEAGVRAG